MLLFQDARRQALRRVSRENGNPRLSQDRPVIELLIHDMHGAARLLVSGRQDRLMHEVSVHPRTAVLRQEGRMNIQDAPAKGPDDFGAQFLQIPGQTNHINTRVYKLPQNGVLESRIVGKPGALHDGGINVMTTGAFQRLDAGLAGQDQNDFNSRQSSGILSLQYRFEIAAAA